MKGRGQEAEKLAADYLQQRGLTILERNYLCRFGEIDLVARDGSTLVFVEVRMRTGNAFGDAGASITAAKRRRLTSTARHYLAGNRNAPACRFDALLINGAKHEISWIRNAFDAEDQ